MYDNSGRLENINYKYKLQTGLEYEPKNFFINLLLPDRGAQVQIFKTPFRNTCNQRSFNKPEGYTKFVEANYSSMLFWGIYKEFYFMDEI